MHEAQLHEDNYFLTLTYDNENLVKNCGVYDDQYKEITEFSLNKVKFVNFMKDYRKKYGAGIRFFHCGEYGEKRSRPHHHVCIFNHIPPDRVRVGTKNGFPYYHSKEVQEIWGKGDIMIGEVTFESAAYVARYIMKKITGEKAQDYYDGIQPEYITMSRRPGIAHDWWEKHKNDVLAIDGTIVGNRLIPRPPKYYDNMYDITNHQEMEKIKRKRKALAKEHTPERLAVMESIKKHQIKQLKRIIENGSQGILPPRLQNKQLREAVSGNQRNSSYKSADGSGKYARVTA